MQRRRTNAPRKTGLVSTVSAIALIVEKPILRSFAQYGTRPHRIRSSVRDPAFPSGEWSPERASLRVVADDGQVVGRRDIPAWEKIRRRILRRNAEGDLDLRNLRLEFCAPAHGVILPLTGAMRQA
jgi:hypothetical protein